MDVDQIKEGSTGYLTVEFKNKDGDLEAPVSATYRIDCLTNGSEVRTDTAISPIASSVEITLTPDDTAIISASNNLEKRLVTVKAIYGADDGLNDNYRYDVINLAKV